MKKPLIFIKLGGSIITHKDQPNTLRQEVLIQLIEQIIKIRKALPDHQIILGHGHGSFGHLPMKKYQTPKGFIDQESPFGMTVVLDQVNYLNQLIISEFIKRDTPAIAARTNNSIITSNGQPIEVFMKSFDKIIENNLLPIVCGDVYFDKSQGCAVWSTELVFKFLVDYYLEQGYQIQKVVHVGETEGFLDQNNKVISEINEQNWPELKQYLTQIKGIDMTGGMKLKVEESLALTKKGIQTSIISGLSANNLTELLLENKNIGTTIS